jgi:hypothetical protein
MIRTQQQILAVLIGVGLIGLNIWAYFAVSDARDEAARASWDAQTCHQLADRIIRLRTGPSVARNKEEAEQATSQRIESVANACNIAGDALAAIDPGTPVRVADSAYLEKPTTVQLRAVSLPQLIDFLCQLSGSENGLRIKALRLTAPHQAEDNNHWNVELTLAQLIYSPPPREPGKGEM